MKAEQQNIKRLLNTAKGQIDGVNKMIDDDKYCIDISNQIMATIAILKKVNIEILDAHLKCCVLHADDREREAKISEISEVLKKALKYYGSTSPCIKQPKPFLLQVHPGESGAPLQFALQLPVIVLHSAAVITVIC